MFRLWAAKKGGGGLAVLGLSAENVRRLVDGQPVYVALKDLGREIPDDVLARDVEVCIAYGETEEDIAREFRAEGRKALQGRMAKPDRSPPRRYEADHTGRVYVELMNGSVYPSGYIVPALAARHDITPEELDAEWAAQGRKQGIPLPTRGAS